ncbi:MAG TPA: sigma-70 family RNA polymerase sigma factor [Bacteroidales bacterium]|nr:sigma-70 family RNA polymerase sigma factor [Bacteroidales bacterium]
MIHPLKNERYLIDLSCLDDRELVRYITAGNEDLAACFLKQRCLNIFQYINNTRLKELDLDINDLINDFYIFLHEDNWEKLRSFRFESKLTTWINLVATRYLLKKYSKELKEIPLKGTPIEGISAFSDDSCSAVHADLLEAISRLKDKRDQQVLLMGLHGYDSPEIAKHIGTSVNNVYVIKSRAIEKLKELIK